MRSHVRIDAGHGLIGEITEATGLPKNAVDEELGRLIDRAGLERSEVTLDELRKILAEYVQDVLIEAKAEHEASFEAVRKAR